MGRLIVETGAYAFIRIFRPVQDGPEKDYVETAGVSTYSLEGKNVRQKRQTLQILHKTIIGKIDSPGFGDPGLPTPAELIKKSEDEFCRDKACPCPNKGYGQPQGLSLQKQHRKNYALIYIDKYTIFR